MSTTFTSPTTLQNILKSWRCSMKCSRVFVVDVHKGKSKVALNKKHDKKITWVFL